MNIKSPESWGHDSQVHCLRVEVSVEKSLMLPFDQFIYSELTCEDSGQLLRLVFATHEVSLRGCCLKRVETTMQKRELNFVRKTSKHYKPLVEQTATAIWEINVTQITPEQSTAE